MGILSILSSLFSMTTVYLGVTAIVLFLVYDYWTHTYFKRLGIPGPPPYPILGNAGDLAEPVYEVLDRYAKKYGPVVGMYLWRKPILVITDLDMLRSIMIKDHHKFRNKPALPVDSGSFDLALFLLRDSQWKRVRDIVSPTFTGKKMKMMSGIINDCADTMVEKLQESCDKDGGTLESYDLYGCFVMDTIATCGFGLKVNSQRDKDDPFVKHVSNFFKLTFSSPLLVIASLIPWIKPVLKLLGIYLFPKDDIKFFTDVTEKAVALRESVSSEQRVDFLQLLIDAKNGKNQTANENDDDDIHNKYFKDGGEEENMPTKSEKYITREELLGQSMIFLAAGYETTSALLALTSYLLAMNPDEQDKLIAEIEDIAPRRDDVSYTTVSKMPYLDQVICEVLRIYPPAAMTDRECGETCTYKGRTIEKDITVWIPTYNLHRNPEYWPNPTKFDPDRFTKENREGRNPFTWIPFGAGPRICIGMRFALMEAKMALVRSLQVVRFEVSPQTKIPPALGRTGLLSPPDGITVKVVRR